MWERIKKRIEKILWEEVEVEVEEDYNPAKKLTVEEDPLIRTKVTYQYPNQKKFPFPLIPDHFNHQQEKIEDKVEIPAYKRRQKIEMNIQQKTPSQKVKKQTDEGQKTKKSQPFQPSRVASPIYGYQKPIKRAVEEPAYLRKKQERRHPIQKADKKEQTFLETALEKVEMTDQLKEKKIAKRQEKKEIQEKKARHFEGKEDPIQKSSHIMDKNEHQKDFAKKHDNNQKRNQPGKSMEKNIETIPFNVMMTASDKKRIPVQKTNRIETLQTSSKQNDLPLYLLNDSEPDNQNSHIWLKEQKRLLEKTMQYFHVAAEVVRVSQGPSVTRFEVRPEIGVKVSKIRNLSDDLKLNMAAKDIRIEAPIPGKNTVGIEVPNPKGRTVTLQEIFETDAFKENTFHLPVALGLDIEGTPVITDINKMPHGLIAGATGSGKSVCINSILISILYQSNHEEVKFLLIDPKMVELAPYNGIPHLLSPVITDVKAATAALKWAVKEMEERYERFVEEGVRDIQTFNEKLNQQGRMENHMPYIVIVIDELADLMMMSPQDVEDAICRIAQKARAAGIHLIIATQRPSVDVITGLIKANVPTRIAFSVSSQVDSRTILDHAGAEKLLGKGDMLFLENGVGKTVRLQGPFVSDTEIERVTAHVRNLGEPNYAFEQKTLMEQAVMEEEDELLPDAIQFVLDVDKASTSLLQRHFRIGYNRAARLMDTLENRGIISTQNGSKPREVLLSKGQYDQGQ